MSSMYEQLGMELMRNALKKNKTDEDYKEIEAQAKAADSVTGMIRAAVAAKAMYQGSDNTAMALLSSESVAQLSHDAQQ